MTRQGTDGHGSVKVMTRITSSWNIPNVAGRMDALSGMPGVLLQRGASPFERRKGLVGCFFFAHLVFAVLFLTESTTSGGYFHRTDERIAGGMPLEQYRFTMQAGVNS